MENATLRAPSEGSKLPHSLLETLFSHPYQKLSDAQDTKKKKSSFLK